MASSQPATLQGNRLESPGSLHRRRHLRDEGDVPWLQGVHSRACEQPRSQGDYPGLGLESYGLKILERNPLSFRNSQQP